MQVVVKNEKQKCDKCGSERVYNNGRHGGSVYYECQDCGYRQKAGEVAAKDLLKSK